MSNKRPSYREAIAWIAVNDSAGDEDAETVSAVSGLITVALVADIFGKPDAEVGADVVRYRERESGGRR